MKRAMIAMVAAALIAVSAPYSTQAQVVSPNGWRNFLCTYIVTC